MVALDEVDGVKSSIETYRTCTDKENTEPLYAKITKKKSSRYRFEQTQLKKYWKVGEICQSEKVGTTVDLFTKIAGLNYDFALYV